MSDRHDTWLRKYLAPLVGGTITEVGSQEDDMDGKPWPTFTVRKPDGTEYVIEVAQDEEGNGAGFLFGLPTP